MSEIEITQEDRSLAKRIVRDFRQDGWPLKEDELAGLLFRYRQAARERAFDEAAEVAEGYDSDGFDTGDDAKHWIATAIRKLKEG